MNRYFLQEERLTDPWLQGTGRDAHAAVSASGYRFLRSPRGPPLQLFCGEQKTFNRLTLDESVDNLRDVRSRNAPVKKVIGFD